MLFPGFAICSESAVAQWIISQPDFPTVRAKLSGYSNGVGRAEQVEAMEAQWTQRETEAAQERAEARKLAALFQQVLPVLPRNILILLCQQAC